MRLFFKLFLLITIINPQLSIAQVINTSLYNETRLLIDMTLLNETDEQYITDVLKLRQIYVTHLGDIGIYQATEFGIEIQNDDNSTTILSNIIDINNNMRQETQQDPPGGATDDDNLDLKLHINNVANATGGNGFSTPICPIYNYILNPNTENENTIKVAVFDTGINTGFKNNSSILNLDEALNNTLIGNIQNDNVALDDNNHGTHVAYTISNISGNAEESNTIEFYDYKIMDQTGSGYLADLIMAVDQAVNEELVNILNISLSSNDFRSNYFMARFLKKTTTKNIVILTSAGNNSLLLEEQYSLEINPLGNNFFTVGSLNCKSEKSKFSNFGEPVDVFVQGEKINSLDRYGMPLIYDGTSQATAVLTGIAASLATHQSDFDGKALSCALRESIVNTGSQSVNALPTVDVSIALENLIGECSPEDGFQRPNNNSLLAEMLVAPNPASSYYSIILPKGEYDISVINIIGQVVEKRNVGARFGAEKIDFDVNGNYNNGLHIISILDLETKEIKTQKLFIQK